MGRIRLLLSALFGIALFQGGAASAQGLPGGASALNETHGDWSLACATSEAATRCAISQTLLDGPNRQRVLALDLQPGENGMAGTLLLPFGLALSHGASLAIDEAAPMPPLPVATCLPQGCIAPLVL